MTQKTCCVDFDGTLHPYSNGWTGMVPDDEPPTDGAREALRALRVKGYLVVVFSARATTNEGVTGIRNWLARYSLLQFVVEITAVKPIAVAYIDDRAVPFNGNWFAAIRGVDALAAKEEKEIADAP